jgi:hypothetical protein
MLCPLPFDAASGFNPSRVKKSITCSVMTKDISRPADKSSQQDRPKKASARTDPGRKALDMATAKV